MRFLLALSTLLLLQACKGSKQLISDPPKAALTTGTVLYDIKVDATDPSAGVNIGKSASVYFNEQLARQEDEATPVEKAILITDLSNGESISYVEFMGKKFAIELTGPTVPKLTDFVYTDEVKTIAGYECKKATASMFGNTATIYYTDAIAPSYCPYSGELKGFALEYTLPMSFGQLTYTATKVITDPPPAEKLERPEGYRQVTPMELQKELMNQSPSFSLEEIPDFSLIDMDGNTVQLSELQGKVVVLNFWFIACKPCQMEMPDLNELKAAYANQEVAFLAITFDTKAAVSDFLGVTDFDFTILPDASGTIQEYGIMAFPTTVVVGKDGALVDSVTGGSMNIKEIIQGMIEKGLQ
ncbi:MAG: redoxin domain-containing protein [Bacteroidota bacterium]